MTLSILDHLLKINQTIVRFVANKIKLPNVSYAIYMFCAFEKISCP